MPIAQVSWIWIWIPTKEYEQSEKYEEEVEIGSNHGETTFEELVDKMKKCLLFEKETAQLSQDGKFRLIQFCVKNEVRSKF